MKQGLILICTQLRQGVCGVSDYTQALAQAVARIGVRTTLVGSHDTLASEVVRGSINSHGATVETIAIPQGQGLARKEIFTELRGRSQDIFSYQFPSFYHYHSRGLPLNFGSEIANHLPATRLHVMCHETWWDTSPNSPLRRRIQGWLQRAEFLSFLRRKQPFAIHSHIEFYLQQLRQAGFAAEKLPLFSNIPISNRCAGWVRELVAVKFGHVDQLVGVFGTVQEAWDPMTLIEWLIRMAASQARRLALVFVGRGGPYLPMKINLLQARFGDNLPIVQFGERPIEELSNILSSLTYGISTSTLRLAGKSGGVVAMLHHGVPVLIPASTSPSPDDEILQGIHPFYGPQSGAAILQAPRLTPGLHGVEAIATRCVSRLGFD
jgi:glycosyltransferase involved in cell wall biosynthesis